MRRAHALQLLVIAAFASACTFSPDYSRYPTCDAELRCPAGYACWRDERRCLPLCGESCPDGGPALRLPTRALPGAVETVPYVHTFSAEGGLPPYSYTLDASGFPPELSLSPSGTLSGTPARTGTFGLEVRVRDEAAEEIATPFSLEIRPLLRIGSPTHLSDALLNQGYSESLYSTGGTDPTFTWALASGSTLPAGLTLSANGLLSGTPTQAETNHRFTAVVTDSGSPPQTVAKELQLTVRPLVLMLTLLTPEVAEGRLETVYRQDLKTAGGTGTLTWSLLSGALPTGVSLDLGGGYLSGTPKVSGRFDFTVKVTDSAAQSAQTAYTLVVH